MDLKNHYFWAWFLENHLQIKNLRTLSPQQQKEITYWLDWHLHFYSPGLDYLLVFHERRNQETEMIITANGDPHFFGKVEALVEAAPAVPGWEFTTFIQPSRDYEEMERGLDKPYVFQDITLKTSDLRFLPLETDRDKIDMIVYLKNFTVYSKNKNLPQLIFIMLQDLLGEKILHENIGFVELAKTPGNTESILELYQLESYLDEINRKDSKK